MQQRRILMVAVAVVALFAMASATVAAPSQVTRGEALFQAKCAVCHGATGNGKGPAAYLTLPKPRDLTTGVYKFKSTETGSIPTDDDIFRTVTRGVPGTSMPSWASLSEEDRWALVAYLKALSPRFQDEEAEGLLDVPAEPAMTAESVARGADVYKLMKCAECHGEKGLGDGPSSDTLKDNWGYPVKAFNFTTGYKMRGGGSAPDIFRTFTMGLEGTPMPAYGPILTERQSWDLVHYVQSLGVRPAPFNATDNAEVLVHRIDGAVPLDPTDALWHEFSAVAIPVRPLWTRDNAADFVFVRALTNGSEIGFLVEWPDAVADRTVLRVEDFRDGVALQFPVQPAASVADEAFYGMGDAEHLVNIWHWKADWQADLGGFVDIGAEHPGLVTEFYPMDRQERRTYSSGWAAGNLMSARDRTTAVEDLNATGQGTLTSQPAKDQNVQGRGVWADGVWRVAFKRDLKSRSRSDAQFDVKKPGNVRLAVAVWDGAENDRNGQKLVSEWHAVGLAGAKRASAD